jgi:[ribosomal protein S5]-alanine N-acetyltransferase
MAQQPSIKSRLRPERPWREHLCLYVDLFGDPPVGHSLWPGALGGPRTPRQASEILAGDIHHWHRESFGPWVFFESQTGLFVGRGGLRRTTVSGRDVVEVLYALRSDSWGRGYASEIARLALAEARRLELPEVVGFAATTNTPSLRVLHRVGIRFEEMFDRAAVPHRLGRVRLTVPLER